jgi:tRNA(fMet)-specific endonuclease VapC
LFLLDTDILSLVQRGDPRVAKHLCTVPATSVATSIITVEEMFQGRLAQVKRAREGSDMARAYHWLRRTLLFFDGIQVLPFDNAAAENFAALRKRRLRIGSQDLKIAATALRFQAILVSFNRRDFSRVPGLRLADWTDTSG